MRRSVGIPLAIVAACGLGCRTPRADERAQAEPTERLEPLHAWSVGESAAAGGWMHYHQTDVDFQDSRLPHEPMAPEGTRRATLVAVPGCRCGEAVMELLDDGVHLPDEASMAPDGGADVPRVATEIREGAVWAWIQNARSGVSYTIHMRLDPPDAIGADPLAVLVRGEFASFPYAGPIKGARGRLIRFESMRHLEVPSR